VDGEDLVDVTGAAFVFKFNFSSAGEYDISVVTSDGGFEVPTNWTLIVNNTNRAPAIGELAEVNVTVGEEYNLTVVATDPDPEDVLEYSIDDPPDGMEIDPATGRIVWVPNENQVGKVEVTVQVSDGKMTVEGKLSIEVIAKETPVVNHPPQLGAIGDQIMAVDEKLTIKVLALDPDEWDEANLSFYLVDPPTGMTIDENTGILSWTPKKTDIGTVTVTYGVTDGKAYVNDTFTVEVKKKEKVSGGAAETSPFILGLLVAVIIVLISIIIIMPKQRKEGMEDIDRDEEEEGTTDEPPSEEREDGPVKEDIEDEEMP
jgi:hypothetical protein